jgi:hypothetical protein
VIYEIEAWKEQCGLELAMRTVAMDHSASIDESAGRIATKAEA